MIQSRPDARLVFGLLLLLAITVFWLHLSLGGTFGFTPATFFAELFRGPTHGGSAANVVVWEIRGPRAFACLLAGGLLGLSGSAVQMLYRNPLAEPFTLGASGGAAAGGVLVILLGLSGIAGGLGVVVGAVIGSLVVLTFVLALARSRLLLLLAGVAAGTMTAALTNIFLILAHKDTNQILMWLMGSTSSAQWPKIVVMAICLCVGALVLSRCSLALNVVAVTERAAESIGVNVVTLSRVVVASVGVMTAVAVGSVGIIGFVGLVSPMIARAIVGVDAKKQLPVALLGGAILMTLADILAIRVLPGRELPIGAVTAVLGAPALMWAVARKDRG